jgi:hypothetical protein
LFFKEWTEQLFHYGHNPLHRNLSSLDCLEKFHSRIINGLVDDRFDKKAIPVRKYFNHWIIFIFLISLILVWFNFYVKTVVMSRKKWKFLKHWNY